MTAAAPSSAQHRRGWLGLAAAAMSLVTALWLSPLADVENGPGLELLYALRGIRPASPDVVIVALDTASAQALGLADRPERWPRSLHARLINGLVAHGAAVIGFDMLFAEAHDAADDRALHDALREAGNVVLAETIHRETIRDADGRTLATADRRVLPLPLFADAAMATAPFVLPKTPHGILEFWTVVPTAADRPALPTVIAARLLEHRQAGAGTARRDPPGALPAPLLAPPRRILNLHGPLGTIPTLSYARALELLADPAAGTAAFAGKAVLVGYSEPNQSRQRDAHPTPYSGADGVDVSGVELCATAVANLLQQASLRRPPPAVALALVSLHAGMLALPWALLRARAALAVTLGLALGWGWIAHQAFAAFLWLPLVVPAVGSPLVAVVLGMVAQRRRDRRHQALLEQAVELGLPRRAMERLAAVLGDVRSGRTVFAVCLCTDIVGYTPLSEALSPEAARDALNRYFARFVPIVERHGGYVADMVGDAALALWIADGDPQAAVDKACRAALALDRAMNGAGAAGAAGALPTRLGLHCGPVFFGEVGADGRREIRAVGDIVNTTSRIQGANKYLHTRVLASGEVGARLDAGLTRRLGRFLLVGKAHALELMQVSHDAVPPAAAERFALGLAAFEQADFAAAGAHFSAAREAGDTGPATFYAEHCRQLAGDAPGACWCGAAILPGK